MATIAKHISNLRGLIKQVQDDTHYTDPYLYDLLNSAKNKLREQTLSKNNHVSKQEWVTYCIGLERAKSHNCSCVKVGCDVLKSVYKLPGVASSARRDEIVVRTLGDKILPHRSEEEIIDELTDDVKSGKPSYTFRNSKLIIWNNLEYKAIQVSVLPEDITEWSTVLLCNQDGEEISYCFDITRDDYDLSGGDQWDAYTMTLQLLGVPLKLIEDINANNNPNI